MKKSEFIEYIKRKLGYPVVEVELTDTQIKDAINETLDKYTTYAVGKATEEGFLPIKISAGTNIYELPDRIKTVVQYSGDSRLKSGLGLFSNDSFSWYYMLPYYHPNFPSDIHSQLTQIDLVDYTMIGSYLNILNKYSVDKYSIQYHDLQNRIVVTPMPKDNFWLLLRVFSKVKDEILFNQEWVKRYAVAISKLTLGEIRAKYTGVNLPGGGSINGDRLIPEAKEEIQELLEELEEKEALEGLGIILD